MFLWAFKGISMKNVYSKFIYGALFASCLNTQFAAAQEESQEQLFQNYQAMVIIEEANQRCPILSRLEAEVLNGQIVFADDNFGGNMSAVEQFKKEARIFARRADCNSPEIQGLVGIARQQANDYMINHMLLARQVRLLDEADRREGKIPGGLLLSYLLEEEWALVENLYEEVKSNYLSQATEEDWEKFVESIEKVAEERKALEFLTNESILQQMNGSESFQTANAKAKNMGISAYYRNLEKSVRAFIEGSDADETGYPFSRPANDFTNWTAYRPRNKDLTWVVSYEGCGENSISECTLFTNVNGEVGLVLPKNTNAVTLEFRNPENDELYRSHNAVEGPIGSNMVHKENMDKNIELFRSSVDKQVINAQISDEHNSYLSQVGSKPPEDSVVFMFPMGTLEEIEKLKKNDLLYLTVEAEDEDEHNQKTYTMPVHNYHRAKNWAYAIQ